jgi:hypothetical protein
MNTAKYIASLVSIVRRLIGFDKTQTLIGLAAIKSQRNFYPVVSDLRQCEVSVFSQNGEDGIIDFLLEICGIQKPNFVEVGAGTFQECNSRFCNLIRNSNLYLVDKYLDSGVFTKLYLSRMVNSNITIDNSWISKDNINVTLERAKKILGDIHVLSIDLDGNDYWILKSITNLEYAIIIIEYNPSLSFSEPVSTIYQHDFDRKNQHFSFKYYGASLEAFVSYLTAYDYSFVGATSQGTNAFFIKNSYLHKFNHLNRSINSYKNTSSREARDEKGGLSFANYQKEREILSNKFVINTETGELKLISDTY